MSELFHHRMIDGEETNYQLGYQPQPTRSLNPPLRLKLLSDKIYISHNGNLSGAYYQTASSPFIWQFYLSCRIRISVDLSVPNFIQSVLLETYGTSVTLSGCRAPSRERRIVMKFLRPAGSKRMEFDYHVHLQAFVSQQAAFGEQLRGDTLQNSQPFRHFHL